MRYAGWMAALPLIFGSVTVAAAGQDERQDARQQVQEAAKVVRQMEADPHIMQLVGESKGIFVVPDYGRGAVVVGGSGGAGVFLAHDKARWSSPAFFNLGSISIGAQAGASAGSIAMILMSDQAVNHFKTDNTFSLNAQAGLSVVNYSARGQASVGKGDVVLWSDTEGLFAGASLGASNINYDEDRTRAYYGRNVSAADVISGKAGSASAATPIAALTSGSASTGSGSQPGAGKPAH